MKRVTKTVLLLAILLAVACGWASAGIEGSKHDFSNEAWSKDDYCGACHVPHRDQQPNAAPLWDPQADLSRTFGVSVEGKGPPGQGTLICLRCHDGTIAKESVAGTTRERYVHKNHPSLFSSTHGTQDHPVGVDYPQFDEGFQPLTSVVAKGTVRLPDGKVECVSCHDPHNTSGVDKMLVTSNERSALCLTCHKK